MGSDEMPGASAVPDGSRTGPVAGLKVVEFAHVVAGPLAGGLLADLGADVVHVEAPQGGDTARTMGPAKDGVHLWWKVSGRNKRSVSLDLRTKAGREVAQRLVEWADIVITNLRVDTLEQWGLDWPSAHKLNSHLIYLQITGYGASSSMRSAPGFGKMGEARSGVVHLTGFPDGPPIHTGFSHADAVTGLMGAFAVTAALYRRANDPDFDGEWVDIALFEPLYRLIEWQVIVYDQLGQVPERSGNRLAVAPAAVVNTYKTLDCDWVTVTSATRRSVLNVVRLLGMSEDDYDSREKQSARSDELDSALAQWVGRHRTDECLLKLADAGVVGSRIYSVADIVEDAVYRELADVVALADPDLGKVRMQGVIPRFRCTPGSVWRTGPSLGQDNDLVLREWLGLGDEVLDTLTQEDKAADTVAQEGML